MAAFPYGHPRSADLDSDLARLLAKIRAGADFAISQLFLEPEGFLRLRDRLAGAGCDVPLLPGIMPLTTVRTLRRGPELSGAPLPDGLQARLEPFADDPKAFRAAGMDVTAELCARLLAEGVRGLHFYTLNRSTATAELVQRLGLAREPAGRRRRVISGSPGRPRGCGSAGRTRRCRPRPRPPAGRARSSS